MSQKQTTRRNHQSFTNRLRTSDPAVKCVAMWLRDRGNIVVMPPMFVSPSIDERNDYADDGDLAIQMPIEVKHRNVDFSSLASYPYDTIYIDAKSAYDKKRPAPYAYFIVNSTMTHALVIRSSSATRWKTTTKTLNGREKVFYECDKQCARVVDINNASSDT